MACCHARAALETGLGGETVGDAAVACSVSATGTTMGGEGTHAVVSEQQLVQLGNVPPPGQEHQHSTAFRIARINRFQERDDQLQRNRVFISFQRSHRVNGEVAVAAYGPAIQLSARCSSNMATQPRLANIPTQLASQRKRPLSRVGMLQLHALLAACTHGGHMLATCWP